jgi:hypothetical protein
MATTVTVPTRATAFTGLGTITNIVPTGGLTGFSLHDCADPGQVGAHNESGRGAIRPPDQFRSRMALQCITATRNPRRLRWR